MTRQRVAGRVVGDLLQTHGNDTRGWARGAKEQNTNEERCGGKTGHEKQPGKMQHLDMTNEPKACRTP